MHLTRTNDLTISGLQDEIRISAFTLSLVEALWLDTVLAHALDTVLSTRLGLVALRLEDDLAVASLQAEIVFMVFLRLKKLELTQAPCFFLRWLSNCSVVIGLCGEIL